jgi:N-acetylmuramoyl-L-alanine amidase
LLPALLAAFAVVPGGAAAPQPLAGATIVIDPGHNGGNAANAARISRLVDAGTHRKACDAVGAATAGGYTEAAHNLDVALRLERLLRAAGAHVVLTRRTNSGWGPCIDKRAAIGNRAGADAAVSTHPDGGPAAGR